MWDTLDFRDQALVRFEQRELWRAAEMRALARAAQPPRRSIFHTLAARFAARRLQPA